MIKEIIRDRDFPLEPKVSIIIPCYKVEKYLPRCLDSLVNQTLDEIEIICINDGSPDNCRNILLDYQQRYKDKVVIIDKENEGVWRGRQDAIRIAQGSYIGFVDSDDYVARDFCEKLYTCAVEKDADVAVCGFYRVDVETEKVLTEEMTDCREDFSARTNPELLLQLNGAPWNKIFKACIIKDMYDFEVPPKIFDDMMMHLLIYPRVDKVAFVSLPLVYYFIRSDSIMTTISSAHIESTYRAMFEVKEYYTKLNLEKKYQSFLDVAAFLHLGISLMFRISYDRNASLKDAISSNRKFLDDNFPLWKSKDSLSLSKAFKYKGPFLRIYLGRVIYKLRLMPLSLKIYRGLIGKGKDIKW